MRYKTNPEYQKKLAKLMRLGPEQRAILSSAGLEQNEFDKELMAELNAKKSGDTKKHKEAVLSERGRQFDASHSLRSDYYDNQNDELNQANLVAGLGILPQALMGWQQGKKDEELAKKIETDATRLWRI